jgi:anti-sigma28 factor (negative regulator of flagellin synthesis)
MAMKLIQKKSQQESTLKKQEPEYNFSSKKELARLKADYKSGKLKFDSKEVAKSILNDCKRGLLEE